MTTRRRFTAALAALGFARTSTAGGPGDAAPLVVLGAASLTDALQEVAGAYRATTGRAVRMSFGASAALARQIEAGARADLFVSADVDWMDYLQQRRLIRPATRRNLLANRLVLITPADSALALRIAPGFPLRAALGRGRLAVGDPDSVPAGRYARAALQTLGVWDQVADRLVRADSVRAALTFVARGDAPLGIVYETDALLDRRVRRVGTFAADSHPAIVYPVALTTTARPGAEQFLAWLRGPAGSRVFRRYGFRVLP